MTPNSPAFWDAMEADLTSMSPGRVLACADRFTAAASEIRELLEGGDAETQRRLRRLLPLAKGARILFSVVAETRTADNQAYSYWTPNRQPSGCTVSAAG